MFTTTRGGCLPAARRASPDNDPGWLSARRPSGQPGQRPGVVVYNDPGWLSARQAHQASPDNDPEWLFTTTRGGCLPAKPTRP
ncbi:MAG: hypothetical protein AB7S38_14550, partial [Vulcanimicrobiota bacterium]